MDRSSTITRGLLPYSKCGVSSMLLTTHRNTDSYRVHYVSFSVLGTRRVASETLCKVAICILLRPLPKRENAGTIAPCSKTKQLHKRSWPRRRKQMIPGHQDHLVTKVCACAFQVLATDYTLPDSSSTKSAS